MLVGSLTKFHFSWLTGATMADSSAHQTSYGGNQYGMVFYTRRQVMTEGSTLSTLKMYSSSTILAKTGLTKKSLACLSALEGLQSDLFQVTLIRDMRDGDP